jgi:hypothetical protein
VLTGKFANADDRILTVGFDQRVLEWRIGSTFTSGAAVELHSEPTQLAVGRDRTLVAGGRGGDIRARTVRPGIQSTINMQQTGAVMAADVSPDDEWVITSGDDGRADLWNVRSGERLSPSYRLGAPIYAVKFTPDGASFGIAGDGVYLHALVPDERRPDQLADQRAAARRRRRPVVASRRDARQVESPHIGRTAGDRKCVASMASPASDRRVDCRQPRPRARSPWYAPDRDRPPDMDR